jgi:hypothetical protein
MSLTTFLELVIGLYVVGMLGILIILFTAAIIGRAARKCFPLFHKWKSYATHEEGDECMIMYKVCEKCKATRSHMC